MLNSVKRLLGHRNIIRLLWHYAKAFVAACVYRFPARKLYIIGVTGTDGKTTTVSMVSHILSQKNIPCSALSTAFLQIDNNVTWNETQKTSPSPFIIQKFLRDSVNAGCTHAVLECSSHGLVQGRLNYIWPHVAAITNISAEHLDYHGSMKQYQHDKAKLFSMLKGKGISVLNRDDITFDAYSRIQAGERILYSSSQRDATISVSGIDVTSRGSSCTVYNEQTEEQSELTLCIPGAFNIENALCAIGCTQALCSLEEATNALASFAGTKGRMEQIDEGQSFSVYIDFTVTPGAYKKTLTTLRTMIEPDKRVLVLTGSCGDRMVEKRPLVGAICSELADVVVVTNEDPYTEDPQKIIDEVWAGVDQGACEAKQIFDRKEAIEWLLSKAREGDAVIFCAKGSDTTMWVKDGQIPWNEGEIVRTALKKLK